MVTNQISRKENNMTDKKKIITDLKQALEGLDITSNLRFVLINTIEYLQKEHVSENLEEAMQHNAPNNIGIDDLLYWRNGFILGAQWQKEQMMKDAIDTTIKQGCTDLGIFIKGLDENKFSFRDKVKVIVIKED